MLLDDALLLVKLNNIKQPTCIVWKHYVMLQARVRLPVQMSRDGGTWEEMGHEEALTTRSTSVYQLPLLKVINTCN